MSSTSTQNLREHWQTLWQDIEQAGGRYQYVQQQLVTQGFLVERRPIDDMSKAERQRYKAMLKKEAAEEKKLKKDAWQAYKSQHIVYLGRHIYWSDDHSADKWDVTDGERRRVSNQLPVLTQPKELAAALNLSIAQLKGLCYQREVATHVPYTHFSIQKRRGGTREIWSPIPTLKTAQRWILQHILEQLPTHGAAHGFVSGRSIVTNAEVHRDSAVLIKLDLKNFFPTIHWRRAKGVFRQAGYPESIATLLALLCSESPRQMVQQNGVTYYVALADRALPQGAPTSPALSNIVCVNMDRRLTGLANKHGLRYSRYADDLTFSIPSKSAADSDAQNALIGLLLGSVYKIVKEEGFVLNTDKTSIVRTGQQQGVTGMVVNGEGAPRVPRRIKRMLRAAIHNLQSGKPLRDGESLATLSGYAAWIASAEPELGRRYLEQLEALAKATPA